MKRFMKRREQGRTEWYRAVEVNIVYVYAANYFISQSIDSGKVGCFLYNGIIGICMTVHDAVYDERI